MASTLRSLLAPEALRAVVAREYGLDATSCVLLRSLVNDVYRVETPQRWYVLKVYRHDGPAGEEVAWEAELVAHLAAAGIRVARVVSMSNGAQVGHLEAPEGSRVFVLSEFVDGTKPRPPFDGALYADFGRLTARFHTVADTFRSDRRRRRFDLARILDEPLAEVLPALADRRAEHDLVCDLAAAARARIRELTGQGLDWGVCHGDVTLDNIHRTVDGLVLHDFDLAGECWRAGDLTGVHASDQWDAFAAGYTQLRGLHDRDLAAIPWLDVIANIGNLRFHLIDKPALRGTESLTDGWVDRGLTALRTAADKLL